MVARTQKAVQVVRLTADIGANLKLITDAPVPSPGEGEVLVNISIRPVNPVDLFGLTSEDLHAKLETAQVPGNEGLGRVAVLGARASRFAVGDRVVSMEPWTQTGAGQGTWQQYVVYPEADLLKVPDAVSDSDAAQFLINPATALGLFKTLAVPRGEWMLHTAAGSVLGRMLVAIAKRAGVKTINVVRRSAQKDELADVVIATDKEDLTARVREVVGDQGVYGALDAVAGTMPNELVPLLRTHGKLLVYGVLSGPEIMVTVTPLLYQSRKLEGWSLYTQLPEERGARAAALQDVWELFLDGTLQPFTGKAYPLEEAVEAVKASQQDARGPKVLLVG